MTNFLFSQFLILLAAMVASGAVGYWLALHRAALGAKTLELITRAKTVGQLRAYAMQSEAEKAHPPRA